MTIKTIIENKRLNGYHTYILKYNRHRKTYEIYDEHNNILTTVGKKAYEYINNTYNKDGNKYYINDIHITITYDTKNKTYTLYTNKDTKINGKRNIEKILSIYGYDGIKEIEKDKAINTKKELKKYLDEYFNNTKKISINIDDIPTNLSKNEFYALCRGFHYEQNKYYVIIDHDLRYITKR